ncbi:TolC family protein [Cytophagaceae bacterium YF14B1]|uniref:TolC family protein n=1 Tax=Xanthocytophaga flava TaxID=3048013 RepID=A0AAE3QRX8_9BACT|nr:TolC family protein [Xanthocytophaga flavus]MDJ1482125.1 TolC family protein [Xanthocytophaga flavus]
MLSHSLKYSCILLVLLLGSCKVSTVTTQHSSVKLPETFTGSSDTTSIGDIAWKDFFTDPLLIKLIDTALHNNPDLNIARQRIEFARASFQLGRGALLPSLNVIASAGVDKYGDYTMNGVGNYDTNLSGNIDGKKKIPNPTPDYFLGLRSSWEIDLWGKLRNQKKAAYNRFLASQKGRQAIVTALVAQVSQFYYDLLRLDNELEIIRKNIGLQEKAVETITAQKMGGRATELAVQQSTAQLLHTRSLEGRVQQEIVIIENQLNLLLGGFPQPIERSNPILQQTLTTVVKSGIPAHMLRHRPDIRQAELELEATKADVTAMRAAFLPSLTISPYAGFNSFNASVLFNPASIAYGILGGLTGPLFSRNLLKSNYKQSQAVNQEAFYTYYKTILNGYQEVVTSMKGIENLQKVYDYRKQEVDVLQNAVSTSNDLYVTGYASYLEVITAQRSVLEAELELATVKRDQFFSLIDLYRSLGGGWQ